MWFIQVEIFQYLYLRTSKIIYTCFIGQSKQVSHEHLVIRNLTVKIRNLRLHYIITFL